MSLPEIVRVAAAKKVDRFCRNRIPPHARDQVRLEYTVRGNSITIVETRPPWNPALIGPEWTRMKIAQLRYNAEAQSWTLWWAERNERWERYWDTDPSPDVSPLFSVHDAATT